MSLNWRCRVSKTDTRQCGGDVAKVLTISCTRNGESATAHADIFQRQADPKRCYVQAFKVNHRKIGAGRAAFGKVEEILKRRGCREIALLTEEPAEGFWLKMGFQHEEGNRPSMVKVIR